MSQAGSSVKNYTGIAAFDLDHTLLFCNISTEFGRELCRRGHLSRLRFFGLAGVYVLHKLGLCSLILLHMISFRTFFRGRDQRLINKLAKDFLSDKLPEVLDPTLVQELETARASGKQLLIYSASPSFLVEHVAQHLQVDASIGTEYSLDRDHLFSSVAHVFDGSSKAQALNAVRRAHALPKEAVTVYSDSLEDLPFLEEAGHPVVVRPERRLRRLALDRGWRVIA